MMLAFGVVLLVFAAILMIVSIVNYHRGRDPIIDPFTLSILLTLIFVIINASYNREENSTTSIGNQQEVIGIENK